MRRIRTTIDNTDETVTRSIVDVVADKLNKLFKLTDVAKHVVLNQKEFDKNKFNIGDTHLTEQNQTTKLVINASEKTEERHVAVTRIRENNTKILMYDKYPQLSVNILYIPTELEMTFSYMSKSQTQLENMANTLRMLHMEDKKATMLSIFYRLYTTRYLSQLLLEIYNNNKESLNEYGNIEEYVAAIVRDNFTLLSNVTGTKANLGFQQHVNGVLGRFTSNILNIGLEYDKSTTYWGLTFTFTLNYEKPLYMDITHDVGAYNITLSDDFLDTNRYKLTDIIPFTTNDGTLNNVNGLTIEKYLSYKEKSFYTRYITIPEFDTRPDLVDLPDLLRVMTVFITIDDGVDNTLFNLSDLDIVGINEEILEFISEGEHEYVTNKYMSVFHFQLFANRQFVEDGIINIDSELNIIPTTALNKRFNFRVSFNIITDLTLLPKEAIDRLNKYPKIVKLINKLIWYKYDDVNQNNDKLDIDMIKHSGAKIVPINTSHSTTMKTVQVSHIVAELISRRK